MPPETSILVHAAELGEVRNGGRPASYVEGWSPTIAYLGLSQIVILCFRHEDGRTANWYLDSELNRMGGSPGELIVEQRRLLTAACCMLFDGLWTKIMETPVPPPLDPIEQGFFALPERTRRELLSVFLDSYDTTTLFGAVDRLRPDRPDSQVLDFGTHRQPVQREHLQRLLNPGGLQLQNTAFLEQGHMTFPSPFDGRPMVVRHAIILHGVLYAYRAVDEATGTVMFLIAGEIFFRLTGVFFPGARTFVGSHPEAMRAEMPDLYRQLFARLMQHGDLLQPYFAMQSTQPLHAWRGVTAMHIGHVLWNDISGIGSLVDSVPKRKLPDFVVFDASYEPEMYGPLDEIFPELEGRLKRIDRPFMQAIPTFYRNGQCLIRSSGMCVTANVRKRILATVKPMGRASPAAVCIRARQGGVPVIMFGIRVENRTIVDLENFCTTLVRHLAGTIGRAVLVVDGHNSRLGSRDEFIWSHGEHSAAIRPIDIERNLVVAMDEAARGTGITIASTIGLPITESLACGRAARALIAIWGAGLAKYRWICNLPGLVITGHWNLKNLSDLSIYHHPDAMESPVPLAFISPEAVEDLPEAPLAVRLGDGFIPTICNFRIDTTLAMQAVDAMLKEHLPTLSPSLPSRGTAARTPCGRLERFPDQSLAFIHAEK